MIRTARLTISPIASGVGPALHHYFARNAANVMPWEPAHVPGYHDIEQWRDRARVFAAEDAEGTAIRPTARVRDLSEIVAVASFTNVTRGVFQACNLGFSVDTKHEEKGVMFEMLDTAIEHVFAVHGLHRVMASYMPLIERSARLLDRLGFEREGFARSYLKIAGRWEDHVLTARINPDQA